MWPGIVRSHHGRRRQASQPKPRLELRQSLPPEVVSAAIARQLRQKHPGCQIEVRFGGAYSMIALLTPISRSMLEAALTGNARPQDKVPSVTVVEPL